MFAFYIKTVGSKRLLIKLALIDFIGLVQSFFLIFALFLFGNQSFFFLNFARFYSQLCLCNVRNLIEDRS